MEKQNERLRIEIEKEKNDLKRSAKKDCNFSPAYATKEKAIVEFLSELQSSPEKQLDSLPSDEENRFCIYPAIVGYGTALDATLLSDYKKLIKERQEIAKNSIYKKIQKGKFTILTVDWEPVRRFDGIVGFKPKNLLVKTKHGTVSIEEIKMIYQAGSTYKVGVLGF